MDNQDYFKGIDHEIKELGRVATLVILESKRITNEVFCDAEFYPSVLQVLMHLVSQQCNVAEIQYQHQQDELRNRVNREIDQAIAVHHN